MENVNLTIRLDRKTKEQAMKLYEELGMSLSTAISIFLKQSIREKKMPFEVRIETKHFANQETEEAFREVLSGKTNGPYDTFDEMLEAINSKE